jgi:hypothetical protein
MASCAFCGTTIFLGGVKDGELRFCNRTCQERGAVAHMAAQLPDLEVQSYAMKVHGGPCPKCQGPGPNDVFTSHTVWSFILLTSWKSQPQISCKSCAVKSQALGFVSSFFLGWWGIPWGIIMTPVQMVRNLWGMTHSAGDMPSDDLQRMSRLMMLQTQLQSVKAGAGG